MSIAKMLKEKTARYIAVDESVARTQPADSKHIDGKQPKKGSRRTLCRKRKKQRVARLRQRGKR